MRYFNKQALAITELNTLDDLYHTDEDVYNKLVKKMQKHPQSNVGQYFVAKEKPYIFIDHRLDKNSNNARIIRRHELTHYLREKKDLSTARWAAKSRTEGIDRIRSGIGNFVEELTAGKTMFQRGLKASTKKKQFISKYVYPTETGVGAFLGKSIQFKTIRKLLK